MGAVVGVLCNQAMLESLGLSHAAATAGAVAIQVIQNVVYNSFQSGF